MEIKYICDVLPVCESALKNNYEVCIKPVLEEFWKQKTDHYEITFKKKEAGE